MDVTLGGATKSLPDGVESPSTFELPYMRTNGHLTEGAQSGGRSPIVRRVKTATLALLLAGAGFGLSGCYDDPYYYGQRNVRAGYYASHVAPAPYYAYDPYYGYGYSPGIGIGISTYRSSYGYRPHYGRRGYYRGGYRDGYHRGRRYDRNRDGRRDRGRRNWDRRRSGGRERSWDRRAQSGNTRVIRRSTAPRRQSGAPVERQTE